MKSEKKKKTKEKIENVLLWLALLVVVNFFLILIQTVTFYTISPKEGKEVVIGYDTGVKIFSKVKFTLDNRNCIKITQKDNLLVEGCLCSKEDYNLNKKILEEAGNDIVENGQKKKLDYYIYKLDGDYYYLAEFEKNDNICITAMTDIENISEKEAVDLFHKFRATKGIGYYIAKVIETLYSDD